MKTDGRCNRFFLQAILLCLSLCLSGGCCDPRNIGGYCTLGPCVGCCFLMGGLPTQTLLRVPVSFRVVDETTGQPVPGAEVDLYWENGHWEGGKTVHTNANRLGVVNIKVPDILWNEHGSGSAAERKFVYLMWIRIGAGGYRSLALEGLRPYTWGLRGKAIALRPEGKTDGRTVPVEVCVVGRNGEPFGKAEVSLGCRWREGGFQWEEASVGMETDEKGCGRFLWTPPACFESAEACWKLPEKVFSLWISARRRREGKEDGVTSVRVTNGAPVVIRVEHGERRTEASCD
jgi:hypothetical protein